METLGVVDAIDEVSDVLPCMVKVFVAGKMHLEFDGYKSSLRGHSTVLIDLFRSR